MNNAVSLPMYAVNPPDVDALWSGLRELMLEEGINEKHLDLSWPDDLIQHWQQPKLLLSQTCGYPLVTQLKNDAAAGLFSLCRAGL